MSKIKILDLNKGGLFSNFSLYPKDRHFNIRFDILTFCNILHHQMNFRKLYEKMIVLLESFGVFTTSLQRLCVGCEAS